MRVDFLGLEAFLCIAERGSFHRAAAHLNLSQTALSHRMKKLEDDLGLKLLARTTRQVTLTPTGVELLPKARRMMDEITSSFEQLRLRGKERQEHISIACLPTIASIYLPRILRGFLEDYRDVRVRILDHSASEIIDHVRNGEVEFGISIVSSMAMDLEITPLFKESFVLACPKSHPLAKGDAATWQDLEGEPLIRIGTLTGNRILIDDALGSRRESLLWRYEVRHIATAINMVQAGLGLTVLPEFALGASRASDIVAVPIRNPSVVRTIGTIMRKGIPLSPPAEALCALVMREFRQEKPVRSSRKPADSDHLDSETDSAA